MKKLPDNWQKSEKSLRAVQLVFEFSQYVSDHIRTQANRKGLSPSNQIRTILDLPIKQSRRPRLSVSLSPQDYEQLAGRYQLEVTDKLGIRRAISEELIECTKHNETEK